MDGICLAVEDGEVALADLPLTRADSLGPLLELHHTIKFLDGLSNPWLASEVYKPLIAAKTQFQCWYHEDDFHLGFIPAEAMHQNQTVETDFYIRSKRAAVRAGFSKNEASQLVAAIVELYNNVIEHSGNIGSAYIAFSANRDRLEFVVTGAGMGVLESLKTNPDYANLKDSGSALELALEEGVSRHPYAPDRGRGFRPVFVGLANISQLVRFRSRDHSRELIRKADGTIPSSTKQKSTLQGFFCSVVCKV